jgi:hypothetical protein
MEYPDECPECGSKLGLFDSGMIKRIEWVHLRCMNVDCRYEYSNEPDPDTMPGGKDDY